ncbi:serine threonine- kinase STY46-like isoform X1 [Brachionus plicatilis]|uniref:Serine threonine-kinase STY46-like isoform X1 n=1 Tax=Brachionus plicatilis TaxID=10195 RepID=A0A3M7QC20_BRAPC|nr:serine threonine- kinase STY46-like isoform X1 [Brachionus plicatilis]
MSKRIGPSEVDLKEEIGDGSYAVVYRANYTNKIVAVKKFDGSCPTSCKKQFENEINILGKLNHQNVIKLFGFCDHRNNNFLVLEYMEGGSLLDLLVSNEKIIYPYNLIKDICNGMEYLHANSILHLDLKSPNVLLNKSKIHAKLADFGIAKISTLTTMSSSSVGTKSAKGTFRWMAPEISRGIPGMRSSDVWSFGCILIEFMTRKLPFQSLNDQQLLIVLQNEKSDLPINVEIFSKVMAGILNECLKREPSARPSFTQLNEMLSKCTQKDFDLNRNDHGTLGCSIKTITDLEKFIENVKNTTEKDKRKDKEIEELKKKLNEKEKDICSINNNLADIKKKVSDLEINKNAENYSQTRLSFYYHILSPPESPMNNFLQNRMNSPSSSFSTFDSKSKHSGRDTGYKYVSRGSANGRTIFEGTRGGFYYLTPSGNKAYVKIDQVSIF